MTNRITKYDQILEFVRDQIVAGEYAPGDRLPSDAQLVRLFSASRPTVSKAMHDLEKEGFLERRTGSGSYVRVQTESRVSLIGMLTPEIGKAEIFEPICGEIQSQCKKYNLSMKRSEWAGHSQNDDVRERQAFQLCENFIESGVVGVFFAPVEFSEPMKRVNHEITRRLDEAGISIVLLDRDLEHVPNRSRFDLVGVDNFRIGMLQAKHFIEMGETRIAYVSRDSSAPTIDLRIAGYRHALEQGGLRFDPALIFVGAPETSEFVKKIRKATPTAIVCSNDATAVMLLKELQSVGLQVPQDVKLIGVDDVVIAAAAPVPLTTIRQPCRDLGAVAALAMIRRIENRNMAARTVSLDVELVVRESCGAALIVKKSI